MWMDRKSLDSVLSVVLLRELLEDELSDWQTRGLEANWVMIFFLGRGNEEGLVGLVMVLIVVGGLVILKAMVAVVGTTGVVG